MATDAKRVDASGGGIADILSLLNTLGGNQQSTTATTSGTADTSALQNVIAQSQALDPNVLLQQVFQQAAGQIPGLSAARANAVGARTGGNAPLQAALDKLLQQTTIAGTDKVLSAQQNNLNTQAQAAQAIANATRGTTQTQTQTTGNKASTNAGLLGAMQLLGQTGALKKIGGLFTGDGDVADAGISSVAQVSPLLGGDVVGTDLAPLGDTAAISSFDQPISELGDFGTGAVADTGDFGFSIGDIGSGISDALSEFGSGVSDFASGFFESGGGDAVEEAIFDTGGDWFSYADGGLVGRDGKKELRDSLFSRRRAALDEAEEATVRGEDTNEAYQKRLKEGKDKKDLPKYADGGQVTARTGGGRRSSAPQFTPDAIQRNLAKNFSEIAGAPTTGGGASASAAGSSAVPSARTLAANGLSRFAPIAREEQERAGGLSPAANTVIGTPAQNQAVVNAMGISLLGMLGVPTAALTIGAKALDIPTQSINPLAVVTREIMSALNPTASSTTLASSGFEGTGSNVGDFSLSDDPGTAGMSTPGALGSGMSTTASLQGMLGGMDFSGITAGAPESGITGTSTGFSGGSGDSGGGSDSGVTGSSAGGDLGGPGGGAEGGGASGADGYRNGGYLNGKGTGTSDSMMARVSDGEYIMPADAVEHLGVAFFDAIKEQFHKPVGL